MNKKTESILGFKSVVKEVVKLKQGIKDESKQYQSIKVSLNGSDVMLALKSKYMLECGHEGKVVWISQDKKSFCVQGTKRSCRSCGKKSSGSWTPIVNLFAIDEVS